MHYNIHGDHTINIQMTQGQLVNNVYNWNMTIHLGLVSENLENCITCSIEEIN